MRFIQCHPGWGPKLNSQEVRHLPTRQDPPLPTLRANPPQGFKAL